MSQIHLRFHRDVDREKYAQLTPTAVEAPEFYRVGIDSAWKLMDSFTRIESGLGVVIVNALGMSAKEQRLVALYKLGKAFSASAQASMVKDLIERGAIKFRDSDKITLPTSHKNEEVDFFSALQLSTSYRNELAHHGVIYWVQNQGDSFSHFPMIGLDNPRKDDIKDRFIPVDITAQSFVDSITFQDWVFRLANCFPPFSFNLAFDLTGTGKDIDRQEFFITHKAKVEAQEEKMRISRAKRVDRFIETIKDYE